MNLGFLVVGDQPLSLNSESRLEARFIAVQKATFSRSISEYRNLPDLGACWLVLCVKLTQAGVITEKGASLEEMPPGDPAVRHFLN